MKLSLSIAILQLLLGFTDGQGLTAVSRYPHLPQTVPSFHPLKKPYSIRTRALNGKNENENDQGLPFFRWLSNPKKSEVQQVPEPWEMTVANNPRKARDYYSPQSLAVKDRYPLPLKDHPSPADEEMLFGEYLRLFEQFQSVAKYERFGTMKPLTEVECFSLLHLIASNNIAGKLMGVSAMQRYRQFVDVLHYAMEKRYFFRGTPGFKFWEELDAEKHLDKALLAFQTELTDLENVHSLVHALQIQYHYWPEKNDEKLKYRLLSITQSMIRQKLFASVAQMAHMASQYSVIDSADVSDVSFDITFDAPMDKKLFFRNLLTIVTTCMIDLNKNPLSKAAVRQLYAQLQKKGIGLWWMFPGAYRDPILVWQVKTNRKTNDDVQNMETVTAFDPKNPTRVMMQLPRFLGELALNYDSFVRIMNSRSNFQTSTP